MKPEKFNALKEKYSFLSELKYNECPDGWYHLIDKLCSCIDYYFKYENPEASFKVNQIKSKFGGLRFYYTLKADEIAHLKDNKSAYYIKGVVDFAETLSFYTCENCGKPGEKVSVKNWITVLCPTCRVLQ